VLAIIKFPSSQVDNFLARPLLANHFEPYFNAMNGPLSLQPESINIGEFRGNILTVFLRRFETRLLDGFKRFVVETHAAAFDNFGLGNVSFRINDDSQRNVGFHAQPQCHGRVDGARGLDRFGFAVGSENRLLSGQTWSAGTSAQT
jgi:hypothetical protein